MPPPAGPPTGPVGGTGSGADAVPVCPRHPDQVAYVRCQRCHRPTCPRCQRPAPVGIQCVDCVAAAATRTRPTTAVFGGRAVHGRPWSTLTLGGLCVLTYLGQLSNSEVTQSLAFVPSAGWSEPWRFLTAAFLHSPGSMMHIAFNMLALWLIGPYLEELLGRVRFVLLYLLSALGGSVMVLLTSRALPLESAMVRQDMSWYTATVGASGAIFGLFGAVLVLNRHLGRDSAPMFATVALNMFISFTVPGISWQAHLGGFIAGLACAGGIAVFNSRERRQLQFVTLGGIAVVLIALAAFKYAGLPPSIPR